MTGTQLKWGDGEGRYLEPVIENGALATGDILRQNQVLLLLLHKGELKEHPAVGVGVSDMPLDNDPIYWRTLIREQLEMDGQRVDNIKITSEGIIIDAYY